MSNQDASFGLRPVRTSISSQQQNRYRIASGYSTAIFQGDLVAMVTGGGIERVAAGGSGLILGVFNGCFYTDPTTEQANFLQIATPVAFQHLTSWQTSLMIRVQHLKFKLMPHSLWLTWLVISTLLINLLLEIPLLVFLAWSLMLTYW